MDSFVISAHAATDNREISPVIYVYFYGNFTSYFMLLDIASAVLAQCPGVGCYHLYLRLRGQIPGVDLGYFPCIRNLGIWRALATEPRRSLWEVVDHSK